MYTTFQGGLSEPRKQVVRVMQEYLFGTIRWLPVRKGEPVLDPFPEIVREHKFAADNLPHAVLHSRNFRLKEQHVDFFKQLDAIQDGVIEALEFKHGLPFRMFLADERARTAG